MSTWPWMKGTEVAIADPIVPLDEHDKRPAVKDLIAKHRPKIDDVKVELEQDPLYDETKHDDLWIVRFLLSQKGSVSKAVKAAKGTLMFRKEHNLGMEDIRHYPITIEGCRSDALKRYLVYCGDDFAQCCVPDGRYGAIILLRFASLDQHGLLENVDEKDWLPSFAYIDEWSFQWCDYITRTTGRLTKVIRIADADGLTMSAWNQNVSRRDTRAMNAMEDFYPQLLQSIFLCNAPSWIQVPWRIFKVIIPQRVLDKMDVIDPKNNAKERKRFEPYISLENLPVRFGGAYDVWPVQYGLPGGGGSKQEGVVVAGVGVVEDEIEC